MSEQEETEILNKTVNAMIAFAKEYAALGHKLDVMEDSSAEAFQAWLSSKLNSASEDWFAEHADLPAAGKQLLDDVIAAPPNLFARSMWWYIAGLYNRENVRNKIAGLTLSLTIRWRDDTVDTVKTDVICAGETSEDIGIFLVLANRSDRMLREVFLRHGLDRMKTHEFKNSAHLTLDGLQQLCQLALDARMNGLTESQFIPAMYWLRFIKQAFGDSFLQMKQILAAKKQAEAEAASLVIPTTGGGWTS